MNQIEYYQQQLLSLHESIAQQAPFNLEDASEESLKFSKTLEHLSQKSGGENYYEQGQWLVTQAIANFAHIVPLIPRDLFWHFGGDCLHFMPDDEIQRFQALDEACYDANQVNPDYDYQKERAKVFELH